MASIKRPLIGTWKQAMTALTLALLVGIGGAYAQGNELGKALASKDRGDFKTAIIILKNVLQKNEEDPEARYLLGQIYLEMGIGSGAEKELRWARRLGISDDEILFKLGQAYLLQQQFRRVKEELQITDGMKPRLKAELNTLYGMAASSDGNDRAARRFYETAVSLDPNLSEAHLGLARVDMADDNVTGAEGSLDIALELNPSCAECWVLKGEMRRKERKFEEARDAFINALDLKPANLLANLGKAATEIELGNPGAVEPHLEAVKEIQPNHPLVNYLGAVIAFQDRDLEQAGILVEESLKLVPDHLPSLLLSGTVAFGQKQYARASDVLRRYLDRVPNNPAAIKLLAASELRQNRGADTIELLRPLVRSGTKDPQVLALFGSAFFQTGDHETGNQYLKQAQEAAPDAANIRTQLALGQLATGNTDQAIQELKAAVETDSNLLQADVMLVLAQLHKKDYDAAIEAADRLADKLKTSPVPANLKGVAFLGKEDTVGARAAFIQALDIDDKFTTAHLNLARLDLAEGRDTEAVDRLKWILEYDRRNVASMLELSRLAEARGDRQEALSWVLTAWDARPGGRQAGVILARYYLRNGDTEKALSTARTLYEHNPNAPDVLRLLGSAQMAANENASAVTTFQRMANQTPDATLSRMLLASAQAASGNNTDAEENLRKVIEKDPENLQALNLLARVLVDSKQEQEALKVAMELQKSHPDKAVGFTIEGDVLSRLEDHQLSADAYRAAYDREPGYRLAMRRYRALEKLNADDQMEPLLTHLEKFPDDQRIRLIAAMAYKRIGDLDQAISSYQELVKARPNSAIALNNLALLYHQTGDKRAVETAKRAYEQAPGQLAIADTYGWILAQSGDPFAAVSVLEKAVELDPNLAVVRFHLASALADAGDKPRARRELERLMVRGGDFKEKAEAQALLRKLSQ